MALSVLMAWAPTACLNASSFGVFSQWTRTEPIALGFSSPGGGLATSLPSGPPNWISKKLSMKHPNTSFGAKESFGEFGASVVRAVERFDVRA